MLCKFVILAFAAASQEESDVATPQQNEAPAVAATPVPDSDEVTPETDAVTAENDEEASVATHEESVAGGSGKATAVEDDVKKSLEGAKELADAEVEIDNSLIPGAGEDANAAPEGGAANATVVNNSTTIAPEGKAGDESSASAPAIFVAALVLFAL